MSKVSEVVLRTRVAGRGIRNVVAMPAMLLVGVLIAFSMMGLILWSLNLGLLRYVVFESSLAISERISFFLSVYQNIFTDYSYMQAGSVIILSLLFGLNVMTLLTIIKLRRQASVSKSTTLGGIIAGLLGSGCAACGTSLLTPIITNIGLASSAVFAERLSVVLNFLAILLLLFSLYRSGQVLATDIVLARQSKGA
jgi:hypothetical protein